MKVPHTRFLIASLPGMTVPRQGSVEGEGIEPNFPTLPGMGFGLAFPRPGERDWFLYPEL